MQRKDKRLALAGLLVVVVVAGVYLHSFGTDYASRHRVYADLEQKLTGEVLSANVRIVRQTVEEEGGGMTHISYSAGFSGVAVERDGDTCYALTANHAVESDDEGDTYCIHCYGTPNYEEYAAGTDRHVPLEEYYGQLPQAEVAYADPRYDLAIVRFETEQDITPVSIAKTPPQHGDRIAVVGNPEGEACFLQTYGKILSHEPVAFGDAEGGQQYQVVRHSAFESYGSSGSAVYNEHMELAGIDLGGGTDIFGHFRYGMAMPSDRIADFLAEWKHNGENKSEKEGLS